MRMKSATRVRVVYAAFLVSGAAALVYEVVWTRALSLVLGSTTYALSTMLSTFMAGLALGGFLGGKLADRPGNLLYRFGLCELGIGLLGLLSLPLIRSLPAVYLAFYRAFHLQPAVFFTLQVGLCALVMLAPATLMGATFPLVSRAVTGRLEEMGRRVGDAYSFNTAGAVAGSLAAGFLLVPVFGVWGATVTAAALNLTVGLVFVALGGFRRVGAAAGLLLLYAGAFWFGGFAVDARPSMVSYYTANRYLDGRPLAWIDARSAGTHELLFQDEYAEGTLAAFRDPQGHLVLQVGGKPEGTGPNDREAAELLARLPLATHPHPGKVLVIGLGAGVTAAAARPLATELTVVEIHPGVVEAVERFGPPAALDGVRVVRDDARNYLLKTEERYDVVASAPSYPTEFMVSNLFTRDFYEIAARRLADGGVYAQWLPYGLLTDDDVTMMAKTFAAVFPHAVLWRVEGRKDLIAVGSLAPFALPAAAVAERVAEGGRGRLRLSRGVAEMAALARREDVPWNTDDRPLLEFRLARNLLRGEALGEGNR